VGRLGELWETQGTGATGELSPGPTGLERIDPRESSVQTKQMLDRVLLLLLLSLCLNVITT